MEDINNLLNSGEIPNLFPQEDLDRILGDMIPVCKQARMSSFCIILGIRYCKYAV